MYVPKHFEPSDERALWALIDAYPFGTLVTVVDGQPFVSHVPFRAEREAGVLHCHVARANPHWQHVARAPQALAIFMGPHGYISPTWYAGPGGLPTWNYAVVHAHGTATIDDDATNKKRHVDSLAAKFEQGSASPWEPNYDVRRLDGIVGIEIRVTKLEGKLKLGQNRPAADRAAAVAHLASTGRDADAELARLMADAEPR